MNKDKNNFNQIIRQMESEFHKSKAAMEMNSNDSEENKNDSNHQNLPNLTYSDHLDQNIKFQI
jgi:hypothetical protein